MTWTTERQWAESMCQKIPLEKCEKLKARLKKVSMEANTNMIFTYNVDID